MQPGCGSALLRNVQSCALGGDSCFREELSWHVVVNTLLAVLVLSCSLRHGALIPTEDEQILDPCQKGGCDQRFYYEEKAEKRLGQV